MEATKTKQERLTELMGQFSPKSYNFVGKPEEEVDFEFTYDGDLPIKAVSPGCVTCTTLKVEDNKIIGTIKLDAEYKGASGNSVPVSKVINVWFEDDEDWFVVDENKVRKTNTDKISVPLYIRGQVDIR